MPLRRATTRRTVVAAALAARLAVANGAIAQDGTPSPSDTAATATA